MMEVNGLDVYCRFSKDNYRYVVGITDNKQLLCIECYVDDETAIDHGERIDHFNVHRELFEVMFGGAATDRFIYGHPLKEESNET